MSLLLPLLHLEASDAETDALVAGRWVTALAFDFQHFGQLFGPRNNAGTTQEQRRNRRRNKRRNIKMPKKRDVLGYSLNAKWMRREGGRGTGSIARVDKRPCRFI